MVVGNKGGGLPFLPNPRPSQSEGRHPRREREMDQLAAGGKQVYTMRLVQTGRRVRGLHRLDPSYGIDGSLEGNVLKGTWSSPDEVGEFLFELSEDGRNFQGRRNTTNDLKNWKLGWNGRRQ